MNFYVCFYGVRVGGPSVCVCVCVWGGGCGEMGTSPKDGILLETGK